MDPFKRKEIELKKIRAEGAKMELEFKIMEREQDIQRMKDHIKLQEDIIQQAIKDLSK